MELNLNDARSIVAWWQVCPERHDDHLEALLAMRPQFGEAIRRAQRYIAGSAELQAMLTRSQQERRDELAREAERDAGMTSQQARWRELAIAA